MKREMIAFDLGHGITLTMPHKPMSDDILSAFMLLGGLLYNGIVESRQDKAKFPKMMDECFGYIKKGDFSKIAKEVKRAIVFEDEVAEA